MSQKSNNESFNWHTKVVELQRLEKSKDILLAHYLYHLRNDSGFAKASGIPVWEDYIRQPEIGISRHKADELTKLYRYFVIEQGFNYPELQHIPVSKLSLIARKQLDSKLKIQELLDHAEHLTTRDFKEQLYDMTSSSERTYQYVIMKKCNETGNLEKIHDIDSDRIRDTFKLTD